MRLHSIVFIVGVVQLAAGCDPIAGVTLRQRLGPAPRLACVRAALVASRLVADVRPSEYNRTLPGHRFQVFLADSLAPRHAMPPRVRLVVPANDSATLEISIMYFGATTARITPEFARQSTAVASLLTSVVRDACAPDLPAAVTCRIEGWGRSRPCAPAT